MSGTCCNWILVFSDFTGFTVCSVSPADASTYAHYLFNAFDTTQSGSIKFEVDSVFVFLYCWLVLMNWSNCFLFWIDFCFSHQDFVTALSTLLRGSITEKLQWTFNLYDINRDGYINKEVSFYSNTDTDTLKVLDIYWSWPFLFVLFYSVLQEMTGIVRAIYDMMGKYTYPALKTDAPKQHVDAFFQVKTFLTFSSRWS